MKHYIFFNTEKTKTADFNLIETRARIILKNNRVLSIVKMYTVDNYTHEIKYLSYSGKDTFETCEGNNMNLDFKFIHGHQSLDDIQTCIEKLNRLESVLTTRLNETKFEIIDEPLQFLL